tara:strand:- start:1274 stop:3445 length:2172 start_codon:yes stop_codon:yes gene_type:complete
MTDDGEFIVLPISRSNPDIDIISRLEEEGIEFLLRYHADIENGTTRDKYYYKSYIYNTLFEDLAQSSQIAWRKYTEFLKGNKSGIRFIHYIDSDNTKKRFIENLIEYYRENDIHKLLLDDSVKPYFSLKETNLLDKLLERKHLNIKPYIKCASTRFDAMEWLIKYHHDNTRFKSMMMINMIDIYNMESKFKELIDITMQLMDIFQKGITEEKIRSFKIPMTEKYYHDDNLKYINKYFFMLHEFMELSVLNIIKFKVQLGEIIQDIQVSLDDSEMTDSLYNRMVAKLEFLRQLKDNLSAIAYNQSACFEFYRTNCVVWMSRIDLSQEVSPYKHQWMDTILTNTFHYITLKRENENLVCDDILFDLCLDIIDKESIITSSIQIKAKAMIMIASCVDDIDSGFKMRIMNNLDRFVKSLIPLYISVSTFEDYDIYLYQLKILHMLIPFKQIVFDRVDPKVLQKFIYHFLDTYHSIYKWYVKNIIIMYKIKNEEELDDTEGGMSYNDVVKILERYQDEIFIMDQYIIMNEFKMHALHVGNRDRLAFMLGYKLQTFVGKDRNRLDIQEPDKIFKAINHLKIIFDTIYPLIEKPEFKKAIANEERFLKTEYLENMVNILLKKNLILVKEHETIIKFKTKIEEMRTPIESDEDIPDELLDPIMGTLIENPVLLPNTETFIDYDVITRHLLTSSNNPFTRDPLSKTELEEYNARPDIQERIGLFKQRLCNKK